MTALMGTGPGMKGGPYKLIKSVRLWRANCGDDGVAAIVSDSMSVKHSRSLCGCRSLG